MRYDYRCQTCTEIFEVRYSLNNPPRAIICPVCGSGDTHKLIICPAISIRWRDPRSSEDAGRMRNKFIPSVSQERAEDFGGR